MQLLQPVVKTIDTQVEATFKSQDALRQQIDLLQKGVFVYNTIKHLHTFVSHSFISSSSDTKK